MARFIDEPLERDVVNNYIDSYVSSIDKYSKYQDTAPNFVTYYNLDHDASTTDIGLDNVEEIVGERSPLKFNKIKNMALYSVESLSPNFDYDEDMGIDMSGLDTEAVIPPGTITPYVNDFVVFDYMDKGRYSKIFRVENVEISMLDDRPYYKINLSNYPVDTSYLDKRQVSKVYTLLYQNVGTESNPLILEDEYISVRKNITNLDDLINHFIDHHYDTKTNSMYIDSDIHDNHYIDIQLNYFINHTKLFNSKGTYLRNFRLIEFESKRIGRKNVKNSPYFRFMEGKKLPNAMYTDRYNEGIFSMFREKYYNMVYIDAEPDKLDTYGELGIYYLPKIQHINDLVDSYENIHSLNGTPPVEKVIVEYIKNGKVPNDYISDAVEYYDNKYGELDTQDFMMFIMLVYVIRKSINNVLVGSKEL